MDCACDFYYLDHSFASCKQVLIGGLAANNWAERLAPVKFGVQACALTYEHLRDALESEVLEILGLTFNSILWDTIHK